MDTHKLFNSILKEDRIQKFLKELKKHHEETYNHSLRVGFLCISLGEKNDFSEEEIKLLGYSGLLHDLGKLDISEKILNKKSKLNETEIKKIEEHPQKGFLRLKDFEEVKEIILHHHKPQRKSYPHKINEIKKEFCELVQIVAVADMFDALSNERSYKKALSNEEVKKILENTFTGDKIYIEQIINHNKDGEKRGLQI